MMLMVMTPMMMTIVIMMTSLCFFGYILSEGVEFSSGCTVPLICFLFVKFLILQRFKDCLNILERLNTFIILSTSFWKRVFISHDTSSGDASALCQFRLFAPTIAWCLHACLMLCFIWVFHSRLSTGASFVRFSLKSGKPRPEMELRAVDCLRGFGGLSKYVSRWKVLLRSTINTLKTKPSSGSISVNHYHLPTPCANDTSVFQLVTDALALTILHVVCLLAVCSPTPVGNLCSFFSAPDETRSCAPRHDVSSFHRR